MYENLRYSFCMKTANMGSARTCLYILVLVNLQLAISKPFFGSMFCDMLCVEYEDGEVSTSSSTTSFEDDLFDMLFDPCSGCPTNGPRTPRPATMAPPVGPMPPFGPPFGQNPGFWPGAGGPMNGTVTGPNGSWWWFMGQGTPPAIGTPNSAPATTAAPAATTTAPAATTAAPGGTTAAPGGTTAAPGGTTAAPATTTAAP